MKKLYALILLAGIFTFPARSQDSPSGPSASRYDVDTIQLVYEMIDSVDTAQFMPTIRHLASYYTRLCTSPQAIEAQNWVYDKFASYGLSTELQDFPYTPPSSDNVIATLPGKLHPDEYVVVGSHYDSFTFWGAAPGADDNASGTSAVLELARILSQHEFERTIIFCTFSAEEVGLVGSNYYASHASQQGMDILGYFNFDMIGYQYPGDEIHTDMIAPASAQELVDFYTDVAAIYLPDFPVLPAEPIGGDSDHTSFNNNGYMGIFPFEDTPNYSPYIHTTQDIVGVSVNSPEMARKFIQANLASVATLAVPYSTVGIGDPSGKQALVVYPNPASSQAVVKTGITTPCTVKVIATSGQCIMVKQVTDRAALDLSSLTPGIYVVTCTGDSQVKTCKLIVQ